VIVAVIMDASDIEDMLFGLDDSQDALEDISSDLSDEDMLGDAENEQETLWDLDNDAVLTPATSDCEMDDGDAKEVEEQLLEEEEPPKHPLPAIRDR